MAGRALAQEGEADVFSARAILAYEERRYDDALDAARQALEINPDHLDALYYTGLALVALGRVAEAVAPLERARTLTPNDEAILFQLGVTYFALERFAAARPLLEAAFAINPKLDSLGYYVGYLRYRAGDYQRALRAFRQGTSTDPNIQQLARYYTALSLAALGFPERVAPEIEEALRLLPASPLTGPAERLRETVRAAREGERRFRVDLRVGGFYDDNVRVVPEASGDPSVQDFRRGEKASPGEIAFLRLDYTFLRRGSLDAAAMYSFFTTYNNELPGFNLINHAGGVALMYRGTLGALPYHLTLPYTYDFLTLGGHDFVQRHTVSPFATLTENAGNLTTLQLRFQEKDFFENAGLAREESRDGTNWMVGLAHVFRFQRDRHLLKLGYQWDVDDTDGSNHRYAGHRLLAGGQYTLPWKNLRLAYDFDFHIRNYTHRNTVLPRDAPNSRERFDTEANHVVALTVPLPWSLSLVTQFQATQSRSNLDLFAFNRNVVFVYLLWSY